MDRRAFLKNAGGLACASWFVERGALAALKPDFRLRIQDASLEIGPGIHVRTTTYNGIVPGPLLRLKQGRPVAIEVSNESKRADLVHWHGLSTDALNDGAVEEGSPVIPPGGKLTYHLKPSPAGTRWYHSHAMAMDDLGASTYSGQFGFLLVDPPSDPARYDQEINLAVHHWEPSFVPMIDHLRTHSQNVPQTTGSDVGYKYATINAHMLGFGEPLRVREGERVLFRLLNASATENTVLALPGHRFRVIAMDGNPVKNPASVEVLSLGVAERIDAIVEMNNPGCWILGSTLEAERKMGLGVFVEYAGKRGAPVWSDPAPTEWDYTLFASKAKAPQPDEVREMIFRDAGVLNGSKFDTWTINGKAWPQIKPMMIEQGKRYRLRFVNASGDQHPMHLHRHTFEVTRIGDRTLSGLYKDTVLVMPLQTVEVDFIADNPGDTLFHCHQQLHMDYGFMQLLRYTEKKA
ncbi:MAG: multicopper oxidase family protein [Acidobacteria bacterium]|nr:multicopper oxidase family protein [Acidobacteriota bacterium]